MSDAPHLDAATPDLRAWFDVPTLDPWTAEATRLLKGKPLDGLTRTLPEGVRVAPLHVAGGAEAPVPAAEVEDGWLLVSSIDAGTLADARAALQVDRALGATVRLVPDAAGRGVRGGGGLPLRTADDLLAVAGDDPVGELEIAAGTRLAAWIEAGDAAARSKGEDWPPHVVADPLSELIAGHADADAVAATFAEVPAGRVEQSFGFEVSGVPLVEAGAHGVLEVAGVLAGLVETWRRLADGPEAVATPSVDVRLTAGRDTFVEIAKLRAARLLVDRLRQRADVPDVGWTVCASPTLLARHDPWTNLLRASNAALIGALGGATRIETPPWDRALGVPDAAARRAALTSQQVLLDEAELRPEGVDPAAGSFLLERLTLDLARAAWDLFREIERRGGLVAAVTSGWLGEQLAASRAAADKAVGKRERGIVGVSLFPNPSEDVPARAPAPPPSAWREAAGWEDLRDAASAQGVRAALVLLGGPAEHGARKGFVRPLLDAAGVTSVDVVDVAAFRASGAQGAVICGDDAAYVEQVGPLAAALREAGARFVLLAGRPGEREAAWQQAGLTGALFVGGDVLTTLREAVQGVSR